jgi:hypothetical protein
MPAQDDALRPWQRWFLVLICAGWLGFGAVVELRSAFLKQRLGDFRVFAQAAWAARAGVDLYEIKVDGRWHYCYPPLLAILLYPLADPPPGVARAGMLPFAASIGIWYVLSLLCLFFATHVLASALEKRFTNPAARAPAPFGRRWWFFRLVPMAVCLVPIGHTLMRGQVNLLLLALLCAALAALLRGRRFQAGLWLSGAICVKMIPAFLLLYPIWRRDFRLLAGCALGLFLGLAAIPAAYFGPVQAYEQCRKLAEVMILPGLGLGKDKSRAEELINVTATDSQSILATLHNTLYLDRATRPRDASQKVRIASWLIGGLLTLATLWVSRRRRVQGPPAQVLFFGMLVLNMLFLSPVCHLHYFCLAVPVVLGLMAASMEGQPTARISPWILCLLAMFALCTLPAQIPGCEVLRDCGLSLYGGLLLWLAAALVTGLSPGQAQSASEDANRPLGVAA